MHAFLLVADHIPEESELKLLLPEPYHYALRFQLGTIAEVREFKKSLLFSPQEKTLCVISGVDEAKEEAQNALLKVLEEPPHDTLLFLIIVGNESRLIPTVLSRLTRVKKNTPPDVRQENTGKDLTFLTLSKITDRDEAIELLTGIHTEPALLTIEALKKNGNVTLQLTHYLLK